MPEWSPIGRTRLAQSIGAGAVIPFIPFFFGNLPGILGSVLPLANTSELKEHRHYFAGLSSYLMDPVSASGLVLCGDEKASTPQFYISIHAFTFLFHCTL